MSDRPTGSPVTAPPPLPAEALRWHCDPNQLSFADTSELEANREIIGQDRAIRAIRLGLEMDSPGYNIFLTGFVGTGRNTTMRTMLEKLDRSRTTPPDLCYVHNFVDPDRPMSLTLPAGMGKRLASRMKIVVKRLERDLPQVFEGDEFRKQRQVIAERYKTRQRDLIQGFESKVQDAGFRLVEVQSGPVSNPQVLPVIDGEPKMFEDVEQLVHAGEMTEDDLRKMREAFVPLAEELQTVARDAVRVESEMVTRFGQHAREIAEPVVRRCVDMARDEFRDCDEVQAWLNELQKDVVEHLAYFVNDFDPEDPAEGAPPEERVPVRYYVNVIVDNSETKGAPVVVETAPTQSQLFGLIERKVGTDGQEQVDHLRIKAGSLQQANGGYLVINATDLFNEDGVVWNTLKRALRNGCVEVPSIPNLVVGPPPLKPQPLPVKVKVVLIGDAHTYSVLHAWDEDFRKIFKVRADFDTEMQNDENSLRVYGEFIQRIVSEEKLEPFDRTAVARIAEYGVRLSGRRNKLSTRFNFIADAVREAAYFARKAGVSPVTAEYVSQSLEERDFRNGLAQEKMQEMIEEGSVFIDADGTKVGEVNGLAVYEVGESSFGLPSKITASVSMGNAGIINIEREAELSGRTHDKGVQILSGYLRSKYAQEKPLTLSASICFEQSYHGVDGDSASSTELYAILSALAEVPVRQGLAITGSVNQKGEIQPIGGVNEKIEGFFDVCAARGLTGNQGVLIPESNVSELMLAPRVVAAAEAGQFHVYAVRTIDEGMAILSGLVAGEKVGSRRYPDSTLNGKVDQRLRKLARSMRDFSS